MEMSIREEEKEQQALSEYCDAILSVSLIEFTLAKCEAVVADIKEAEAKKAALKMELGPVITKRYKQKKVENFLRNAVGYKNPVQNSELYRVVGEKTKEKTTRKEEKVVKKHNKSIDQIMKRYTKDLKIQREKELKWKKQMAKIESKQKQKLEKEMKRKETKKVKDEMKKNIKSTDADKEGQKNKKRSETKKESKKTKEKKADNDKEIKKNQDKDTKKDINDNVKFDLNKTGKKIGPSICVFFRSLSCITGQKREVM